MGDGGSDAARTAAASPASGGGKRGRDPEEEVYMDNLHSSKRYLSEEMPDTKRVVMTIEVETIVSRPKPQQPLEFLKSCGECKRDFDLKMDIYIYKGDSAFCSKECREKSIQRYSQEKEFP